MVATEVLHRTGLFPGVQGKLVGESEAVIEVPPNR